MAYILNLYVVVFGAKVFALTLSSDTLYLSLLRLFLRRFALSFGIVAYIYAITIFKLFRSRRCRNCFIFRKKFERKKKKKKKEDSFKVI